MARAGDRAGVGVHELLAPARLLSDQAGPLQHGDVLLDGREAHRVSPRKARNRGLVGGAAAKDVATGRVGQSVEQPVDRVLGQLTYNHMVVGYRAIGNSCGLLASSSEESEVSDAVNTRMRSLPATVVSTTLEGPLNWPNATVVRGDAVDVVARLKEESEVPLRSNGSLSMNRALMAAGLVDRVQVTLFPVITGQTGLDPIFQGAADFDLELIESRTLDGHIQELIYRPTLHV